MLTRGPMAFAMADMTTWRPEDRGVMVLGRFISFICSRELFQISCIREALALKNGRISGETPKGL